MMKQDPCDGGFWEEIGRRKLADGHAWSMMMAAAEPISRDRFMGIDYPTYSLIPLEKLGDAKISDTTVIAVRINDKYWLVDHELYKREYRKFYEGLETSAPDG